METFSQTPKLCIIGLGYVGLPLAVEFGKVFEVIGYDSNENRVAELAKGYDRTEEVSAEELQTSKHLKFSAAADDVAGANFYVVTVPTPIDQSNRPDLNALRSASTLIGQHLQTGDIVVYESTVYPGATENVCVPILEQQSGLTLNQDFFAGYSPERINPGDKEHRLPSITKVTSGSTPEAADKIDEIYGTIITAGTYKAESIQVAEAAKVIENTQRDLNIALVNELAIIFNKLGIDTAAVLEAAGTKWNFLNFRPGLVGGHCIGVDPYYLTHRAQEVGYQPDVILAGRKLNDGMGGYIANQFVKLLIQRSLPVKNARVLVLGFTFKENCPDIRNTRVIDIVEELESFGVEVDLFDPNVSIEEVKDHYQREMLSELSSTRYEGVILAVAHTELLKMDESALREMIKSDGVIYDVKSAWPVSQNIVRL